MKRIFCFLFVIVLLSGCSSDPQIEVTMDQISDVYLAQEYVSWCETLEPQENGSIGTVQVNHINGNYVLFTFFDSVKNAKAYADSIDSPVYNFLTSVFSPDAQLIQVKTYGNICIEYFDETYLAPFESLLK